MTEVGKFVPRRRRIFLGAAPVSDTTVNSVRDWPFRKTSTGTIVIVRVRPQWCVSAPGYISPRSTTSHINNFCTTKALAFFLFQYSAAAILSGEKRQSRKRPLQSITVPKRVIVYTSAIVTITRPH